MDIPSPKALQAENHRLQERVDELEQLITALPAKFYWFDTEHNFLGCNQNQADNFNLKSPQAVIGKNIRDLEAPRDAEIVEQTNNEVIATGQPRIAIEPYMFPDGKDSISLAIKNPFKNNQGKTKGVVGISVDMTEVVEKTSELDNIISALPGHVYWYDKEHRVRGCNQQQAESFGYNSPTDVIGKHLREFLTPRDATSIIEMNNEVLSAGKTLTKEEPLIFPDGKKSLQLSQKTPLRDLHGNVIGVLGISFDITQSKNQEQENHETLETTQAREQIQEERINTMKSVAASIAHELRTPLRAIASNGAGLEKYLPALLETYELAKKNGLSVPPIQSRHLAQLKDILKQLETETHSANTIIDMLLMNIKEANIDKRKFRTCSIGKCIADTLHRYPFASIDQEALVRWDNGQNFLFHGDSLLITHILFNLLKNALYYIKQADKGHISIWLESTPKMNELHFKDTGTGISVDAMPHIFEQFFTQTENGTGVGLSFCKLAMNTMGGDIQCFSTENEFTEFVLSFPLNT